MLLELSVENFAIIDKAALILGPGLTVFTGETGAGKSLLVDAIELVLGARADSSLVRHGAPRAVVSAAFDLTYRPDVAAFCEQVGAELDQGVLYIVREIMAEGRSQCRIGGKLAPLATLKELGLALVDFHGQHDHQSLLHPERHIEFVDWFAQNDALRSDVSKKFATYRSIESRLQALTDGLRERELRMDLLAYQVQEIESHAIAPDETGRVEAQLARLRHVERLSETAFAALGSLRDGERSAMDQIGVSIRALAGAAKLDPTVSEVLEPLEGTLDSLSEVVVRLSTYLSSLETDPQALENALERLETLRRLHRKYGGSDEAVLEYLVDAKQELEELNAGEQSVAVLAAEVERARSALDDACATLSASRHRAASDFAQRVTSQLRDLAMPAARFEVAIERCTPSASGSDQVEFLFCANEGEPIGALARIASGGEISRVMLALKVALAKPSGAPTAIFDEVDTGLGGRAASMVAKKLEELAQNTQVLTISHLPQIAGRAATHYRVDKQIQGGRTITAVEPLSPEARVSELARMLSGEAGETALAHAREILSGN